jgi:hypothetical protein
MEGLLAAIFLVAQWIDAAGEVETAAWPAVEQEK